MAKIGPKTFLVNFMSFLVYALLHLMSCASRFCQMKNLIKIYICDNFHQYSIWGCEVKRFLYWFSIHEMAPFYGFLVGPLLPKTLFSLAEILTKVSLQQEKHCLKNPLKFSILVLMEGTQSLQFCSFLGPNSAVENQKYCKNCILRNIK